MAATGKIINLKQLSGEKLWDIRAARWKARTDLGWLCRNILGFEHVTDLSSAPSLLEDGPDEAIHQPIIDKLQKFPIPTEEEFYKNDVLVGNSWQYTPLTPLAKLPGSRRVLLLDPRGFLKTTINVVAHTIQWIINYPDIAIMVVQSNGDKANDFLNKIKKHFQGNDRFRRLFPEHCPETRVMDWGRQDRFTSEARSPLVMRSEPTVMATSIDKGASGIHVDVMKFSDIVDPSNITGNGLQMVKDAFYMMQNLLVGPRYWIDVEGTRYHNADLYGDIIRFEQKAKPEQRIYKIHARPVFKQVIPANITNDHSPEFLDFQKYPFALDAKGKRIPLWPRRFDIDYLEDMEQRDLFTFATQQLNNPSAGLTGGQPFPLDGGRLRKRNLITRTDFIQNVVPAYKEISIDTAYTQERRSDSSAIVVATFDQYGRCYVEEIIHGKFLPDQLNDQIIACVLKHYRHLKCVKLEKVAYNVGMLAGLKRLLDTRNLFVNFTLIPRETNITKVDRILKTLQPYYEAGDLRFLDDLNAEVMKSLIEELDTFPGPHEDILDAVSDLFQDKTWFGREVPNPITDAEKHHYADQELRKLMQKEFSKFVGETVDEVVSQANLYSPRVGAL